MITKIDKKNIKTERVKSFFLDYAKNIILKEGPDAVTVRKIADLSGYSYGTIYHYFEDLNHLMFEVKNIMIKEIIDVMDKQDSEKQLTVEDIKMQYHMFLDYFINNPNIYRFFYNYPIKKVGITPFDNLDIGEDSCHAYKGLVDDGIIKFKDIPIIIKTMVYGMYGMLSLYFSSNGVTKEKVYDDLDLMIDYILKRG